MPFDEGDVVRNMSDGEFPERIEENPSARQSSAEVYEIPEHAKRCIARLILSRRRQLLRQETGQPDPSSIDEAADA